MLDMGGYGCGARWFLDHAISHDKAELAGWCLEHGAGPNVPPARAEALSKRSLYAEAVIQGRREIAELLLRHGARKEEVVIPRLKPYEALHRAAEINRLIDSGISPDAADDQNTRALNHAAWNNALEAAKALVARGAEIDPV